MTAERHVASRAAPDLARSLGGTLHLHSETPLPYEAPGARHEQQRRRSAFHTHLLGQLVIACVVFVSSVVLCAIGGGLLGRIIAARFPSYYPSVFPVAATQPGFDAVQVGVATGVGQGAAAGVLIGAVVVLSLAIASARRSRSPV